ncbi:hypothetical protein HYH03_006958 [Edaphochlamys debaryana]|uniref:Uncharacterized protein n=1 Tax=Edaphochlamys debaryana TaxID=47281 RepID=A0A836BZQ7_9CHLO|nr:hypothetical protein HYH03_006958 [Edaphochlamys debaryana]|eukprot:KAG2495026.1 hypothetical protein HYH03_006958 [Edaphochlamys debaryana]
MRTILHAPTFDISISSSALPDLALPEVPEEESDSVRVTVSSSLHGITFEQRTKGGPVTIASVSPTGSAAKSAWVKPGCELVACSRALNLAGSFETADFSCAGQELEEVLIALASNARCGFEQMAMVLREPIMVADQEETGEADTNRVTLPIAHGITFEQRTPGGPVTVASVSPTGSADKSAWVKPGCELLGCTRALNVRGSFEAFEFSCAGQDLEEALSALASNERCGTGTLSLLLREPAPAAEPTAPETEEAETVRLTLPSTRHGITFEQRTKGGPVTVASVSPTGSAAKSAWVKPGCELVACSRALNVGGSFEAVGFICAGQELQEVLTALASNARCGFEQMALVLREPAMTSPLEKAEAETETETEAETEADTLRVTLPMPHGVTFEQRTPGGPVTVALVDSLGSAAKSAWVNPGFELLGCTRVINPAGVSKAVEFSCAGQDLEEVLIALASNERYGCEEEDDGPSSAPNNITLVLREPSPPAPTPMATQFNRSASFKAMGALPRIVTTWSAF